MRFPPCMQGRDSIDIPDNLLLKEVAGVVPPHTLAGAELTWHVDQIALYDDLKLLNGLLNIFQG
jgi:hypothetical protein